jgi:Domain of unknown function (DUF4389)
MATYPVIFDVQRPEKFERTQLLLRVLVLVLLAILAGAIGWLFGLIYLAIPVLAAILISQKGSEAYLAERDGTMMTLLRWYLAVYAYLDLITDRFPTERPEDAIRFEVTTGGSPTVGSALLRLIMSIPSAFVLGILNIAGVIVWVIAAVSILIQENYPDSLYNFMLALNRWQARLLGYHASLVDVYPPFAIDSGPEEAPTMGGSPPGTSPPPATAPEDTPPAVGGTDA